MRYDETDIARKYNSARHLPTATLQLWLDAIARHIPSDDISTIVDVGCGTGRFSAALADKFHAQVIGVDPSHTMLDIAINDVVHPGVSFSEGDAEHLPVDDGCASLVYLSMVYHHISNLHDASSEFKRVLRSDGFLVIRNSTKDTLDGVPYLKYFPSAMAINKKRLPSRHDVINTMQANGFSLVTLDVLKQEFASSWSEYCDKVGQRALSDLAALPDEEFETGMDQMRSAAITRADSEPVRELIDLFVFKKDLEFQGHLTE